MLVIDIIEYMNVRFYTFGNFIWDLYYVKTCTKREQEDLEVLTPSMFILSLTFLRYSIHTTVVIHTTVSSCDVSFRWKDVPSSSRESFLWCRLDYGLRTPRRVSFEFPSFVDHRVPSIFIQRHRVFLPCTGHVTECGH